MKPVELAEQINAHLKRFETTPELNPDLSENGTGLHRFFCARAFAYDRGKYVYVIYISYQGTSRLSQEDAERYLAWLDAGNVGRHYEALKEKS